MAQEPSQNKYAMKEFIRSCTYGVLAGTLVGAATLAFTDQPGENLGRVARGASLGLYAGILLGVYVIYIVPNQLESSEQDLLDQELPPDATGVDGGQFRMDAFPLIGENGVEGASVQLQWSIF